mgnify:CR=1 FL=1
MLTFLSPGVPAFEAARRRLDRRLLSFENALTEQAQARILQSFGAPLSPPEVAERLIEAVRLRGDEAVVEWTARLDGAVLSPETLRVPEQDLDAALRDCPAELRCALEKAAANVRNYQESLLATREGSIDLGGIRSGWRIDPIDAAGIYVPGGTAAYPSSVIMNALPALVAGVRRVAVASPPRRDGTIHPGVLAACALVGVREVYRVGGAIAIAAFALGTTSIPRVSKVAGPGNLFVTLAKRALYGVCGIDLLAGPSEICILADGTADPEVVAADLLSQAEHDELSHSIVVTDSPTLAERLPAALEKRLATLPRRAIAEASIRKNAAAFLVPDLEAGCALVSEIASEHVEILAADPERWLPKISNAGAIFVGASAPEALGDYLAGPSHTLPTGGAARFSSGLSSLDFVRRTSIVRAPPAALASAAPAVIALAEAEGLTAHAESVRVRLRNK